VRRVVVTGAGGFVGHYLCNELEARGIEVVRVDRAAVDGNLPLDVRDANGVRALIQEQAPDGIVHLAALSSAGRSFADPTPVFEVNGMGTLNLLEAVRRVAPRCRVVSVGSADAYGPSAPGRPHTEDTPLAPISPYGASKVWQDVLTGQYGRAYNLDTVRVRPFSHTGPGQRPTFVLASFAHQIANIEAGDSEPVLRVGMLDVVRDYLDVRDVVRCYAELLLTAEAGSVWNVCGGKGYLLRELLDRLLALARVPIGVDVDPERLRAVDVPHLVGDPTRLRQALHWRPKLTMDQTLSDLLDEARSVRAERATP